MAQQINLYRARFLKSESAVPALAMVKIGVGLLVLLGFFSVFSVWRTSALRSDIAALEEQQAGARTSLEEIGRRVAVQAGNPQVADETTKLQALINAPQSVREMLQKDLFGNKQGYSDFFIALARQSVQGVQLTKVDITDAGKVIEIYGRSASADRVPRYLQRLAREKVMDGLEFSVFHVAQPVAQNAEGQPAAASSAPARGEVEFILRTQPQAQAAKP